MLDLNEDIDKLAMANTVCWYGHMMRRWGDHVLKMEMDFEIEGRMK